MIQQQTILNVGDNTGAKKVMCIIRFLTALPVPEK